MSWKLIQSDAGLAEVAEECGGQAAVAVDTEFMRRDTYYPKVALLQVCVGERAWLIDPLGVEDRTALKSLLQGDGALRLLHSCSEDLEVFRHWLACVPEPLVDTQRAAALLGEDFGLGYRALVQRLLGIELEKGETRSNWLRRPLTESQCHYAAQDVLQLMPAWRILQERAERLGRMPWILEEGEEIMRAQAEREGELYRRIKGASRLSRRQLEVLRRLCQWRETRAREVDKPRGWVLEDKACLAMAQAMPNRRETLAALDVLPAAVLRRQADALLACVEAAAGLADEELPAPFPEALNPALRQRVKELRDRARELAAELSVAPEILVSSADLDLLVRQANGEPVVEPARWLGWRSEVVIEPLRNSLREKP